MSYGVSLRFANATDAHQAVEVLSAAGIRPIETYGPFPDEELMEASVAGKSRLPLACLVGGIVGGLSAYYLQYYTEVIQYPVDVGGRPLHSWPAFIPVTFELTVLFAALSAVAALFIVLKLPAPYHPMFSAPAFERASDDQFFVCVRSGARNLSSLNALVPRLNVLEVSDV